MAEYLISPNDIPDLIESIIEAFQETDKVSAVKHCQCPEFSK